MLSKAKKIFSKFHPSILFLTLAILLGGVIRLGPALISNFPINDGGLFYTMTLELVENGFKIPEFSSYNSLQIPYAYPPLGFFLAGGIYKLTGWPLIDIFRILPPIFSILSIPAFYLLGKAMLKDDTAISFSVLAFALLPAAMAWLVMGGGITRAPGFVFSVLALTSSYYCFTRNRFSDLAFAAIFSSLTVLFHPEAAVHTAAGIFIFFIFNGRNKNGLLRAIVIALFVIIMTSLFWLAPVVKRHGFSPFFAAGGTGIHSLTNYINYFMFNLTGEYGLTSIGVFGFIGIFYYLSKKQIMLPTWFVVTFLVGPRSANLYEMPIIALLTGVILSGIIRKLENRNMKRGETIKKISFQTRLVSKLFFLILLLQWVFSSYLMISDQTVNLTLSRSDIEAMEWVKVSVPKGTRFLVLSGLHPFKDAVSEWFPAVSDHVSTSTVQGYEWVESTDFDKRLDDSLELQSCVLQDLSCVQKININVGWDYDYIFLRKFTDTQSYGQIQTVGLSNALSESSNFSLVHETDSILIYKRLESN